MDLWQIILILMLPLMMLVFGLFARMGLPKKVNWFAGYRTSLACKNQDTWAFAHRYWGRLMIVLSFFLIALAIGGIILITRDTLTLEPALFAGVTGIATVVAVILSIIPTEIALRKEFDKNGERRQ